MLCFVRRNNGSLEGGVMKRTFFRFLLLSWLGPFLSLYFITPSYALDVSLAWDANTEPDLAGYKLYYKTDSSGPPYNGTGATEGDSPIDVGNVTEFTIHGLSDGVTYYFVAAAYDTEGLESGYSNEVSTSISFPAASPPDIVETIPHDNAGITDTTRVPNDASFCVRIEDTDGIDITDPESVTFTIDDGVYGTYTQDLSNSSVVRVIKLTDEADTAVTKLWVVYDRAVDTLSYFAYDTSVSISVDVTDRKGATLDQATYQFRVETQEEHEYAHDPLNLPDSGPVAPDDPDLGGPYDTGIQVNSGDLEGAKVIYNSGEPLTPRFGPTDEIPPLGAAEAGVPMNLQPLTVFNTPIKIFIPYPGANDVSDLAIYLYTGGTWVCACDSKGRVRPGGAGWMVPGSRINHNESNPSTIEIKVYHFSAVQAGAEPSDLDYSSLTGGEVGGGCFISTLWRW